MTQPRHRATPWSPERDAVLQRDYAGGMARKAILASINALPGAPLSLAALDHRVYRDKHQRPPGFAPEGKLTATQRDEVIAKSAAGVSHVELAKLYGVTEGSISYAARRHGGLPSRVKSAGPRKSRAKKRPAPAIIADEQVSHAGSKPHLIDGRTLAAPAGPRPRDLYWHECAALAKAHGCWRATQDFLLSDLNPKLIARGERPVRIRKMEPGVLPVRYGSLELGV